MRLFTVGKIAMYCEGITHRLEKRKGEDVKVVDLALKIEPFTHQVASALDQDALGIVKQTLFTLSSGDPKPGLGAVGFTVPVPRQNLECYASPDSPDPSICLTHVKVKNLRARCSKDAAGWTGYVHVTFGPLSKAELAYVNEWYCTQRFVDWFEADPSLDFDDEGAPEDVPQAVARPAPMFDDDGHEIPTPTPQPEDDNRPSAAPVDEGNVVPMPKTRGTRGTKKHDPDTERQRSDEMSDTHESPRQGRGVTR